MQTKVKALSSVLLVPALLLSIAGCSKSETSNKANEQGEMKSPE